ncbi:hypothetical protein CBR_g45221 [Chara braunii]|uniref:Myb-like domain-containing protein n=1 Tax=Chara braunii TaxID=69332 RepID=A0A388K3B9_CHABU|nr:hypothetical protein CBR_g45221 [Chara braunii]|eukprot:GBG64525.1 hypothetical protein CBR_g45221 [Chara braunii]
MADVSPSTPATYVPGYRPPSPAGGGSSYAVGREPRSMTVLLAEGDSLGPRRDEESYGSCGGYHGWGMPRGGKWQHSPPTMGPDGEGEVPAGGPGSLAHTSYIASAAGHMHAGVGGATPMLYYSRPPPPSPVGGTAQSMPLDAAFRSHDGQRLHVVDSEITGNDPSESVADLGEDMDKQDAGMGETWTSPIADIAGTQSTSDVTVDISDDGKTDDGVGGEVRKKGRRACGGGRGGDKPKVRGADWGLGESVALLKLLFEEDCMQQKKKGRQQMRSRKEKHEWIVKKLVEKGYGERTLDECERKYYGLLDGAKRIRDFGGKWRAVVLGCWKLVEADGHCSGLMQSVHLQGGSSNTDKESSNMGGGEDTGGGGRKQDNDSADGAKFARRGGGRGNVRRSPSESSVEGGGGGTFVDVAHTLVDATERQTDKLSGSFVDAMAGINKTMADENNTLLQCFAIMLSGLLVGQSTSAP